MIQFSTDRQVRNLKPAQGQKQTEYFHAKIPGFILRVGANSKKWVVKFSINGKRKKYTLPIGYPALSLEKATSEAKRIQSLVEEGIDPLSKKIARKTAPVINDLWEEYQKAERRKLKQKADSTKENELRYWVNNIQPAIGELKVEDITPHDISEILNDLAETAPVSANRLHAFTRVLFKPALALNWIQVHPMQWLDRPGGEEKPRDRVLSDSEIRILWHQFDLLRDDTRDALKLGLLTAQRPNEILSMTWDNIDFNAGTWFNPNTKNGTHQLVQLSKQTIEILKNRERKGNRVFLIKSCKKARYSIEKKTSVERWTAQDLRRTARTLMSKIGVKKDIAELVIAHKQSKLHRTYDLYEFQDEKRDALQRLADEIDSILQKLD